jgi:hypothetical protein
MRLWASLPDRLLHALIHYNTDTRQTGFHWQEINTDGSSDNTQRRGDKQ